MKFYNTFLFVVIFFLFNFNTSLAQPPSGCGFNGTPSVTDCCVNVKVMPVSGYTWTVDMGDGTVITSANEPDNEFTYCYGTGGGYKLKLLYSSSSGLPCGAEHNISVSGGCFSLDSCFYTLCWEMLASCCVLDSVQSITVVINGDTLTYNFTNPIHVTGNYHLIVDEILAILDSLNWGGLFVSYLTGTDYECNKANDPNSEIPGFHFFNSAFPIVSINGLKDCSGIWEYEEIELERENCD